MTVNQAAIRRSRSNYCQLGFIFMVEMAEVDVMEFWLYSILIPGLMLLALPRVTSSKWFVRLYEMCAGAAKKRSTKQQRRTISTSR